MVQHKTTMIYKGILFEVILITQEQESKIHFSLFQF
jgi:hypothetical protein